jgi:Zn-dependent membrane protease YugP
MALDIAIAIVGLLICIFGIISGVISIWLAIRYTKFNKTENSAGMTGQEVARKILDDFGLTHIKVSVTGSLMFGNSYSHYFKKVRLRRMTRHETSLTSLGMGAQKAALAVLAKEGDPDMKRRIRLVPLITFGPFAFIPLLVVGIALDMYVFNQAGTCTMVLGGLGLLFYIYSIVLSITTLKTEKKAQVRANEILLDQGLITDEEAAKLQKLFHLYNVQYVNDIILSVLELIYNVLKIVAMFKGDSSKD